MKRKSVVMSVKILDLMEDARVPLRNIVPACAQVEEGAEEIKNSFSIPFHELALLSERGVIINGVPYTFELFLGADLKMHRVLSGLLPNARKYFCPWCKFCWSEHSWTAGDRRSADDLVNEEFSQMFAPLLSFIPYCRRIPCLLHMTMAFGRKLISRIRKAVSELANAKAASEGKVPGRPKSSPDLHAIFTVIQAKAAEFSITFQFEPRSDEDPKKISIKGKDAQSLIQHWTAITHVLSNLVSFRETYALVRQLADVLETLAVFTRESTREHFEEVLQILEADDPGSFGIKWHKYFADDAKSLQYLHILVHEIPLLFRTTLKDLPWGLGAFSTETEETWVNLSKGMCAQFVLSVP